MEDIKMEFMEIKDLLPYINNPKKHPEYQVNLVASSIREFGFINPIIIDKNNEIIAGHGRLLAAKKLKLDKVPVIRAENLTPAQVKAYRIADNKLTELGEWDTDLLKIEVESIAELDEDLDLDLLGFESEEIGELLNSIEADMQETCRNSEPELPPLPEQPFTQPGDLWLLGRHKLLCGDSFDPGSLAALVGQDKVDAIITDPPYGMDLDTDFSGREGRTFGKKYKKVLNDDKPFDPSFFLDYFKDVKEQFWWGADYYADKLPGLALGKSSWIVWDKRTDVELNEEANEKLANADFTLSEFELCWSKTKHRRKIARVSWFGIIGTQFEPEFKSDSKNKRIHPNQKPVRLYTWIIDNFLKEEHRTILDLFVGSGSLLISCEERGKIFLGIEHDPQYVDGVVKRYLNYISENDVRLIREGKEMDFQEIKEEFLEGFNNDNTEAL